MYSWSIVYLRMDYNTNRLSGPGPAPCPGFQVSVPYLVPACRSPSWLSCPGPAPHPGFQVPVPHPVLAFRTWSRTPSRLAGPGPGFHIRDIPVQVLSSRSRSWSRSLQFKCVAPTFLSTLISHRDKFLLVAHLERCRGQRGRSDDSLGYSYHRGRPRPSCVQGTQHYLVNVAMKNILAQIYQNILNRNTVAIIRTRENVPNILT